MYDQFCPEMNFYALKCDQVIRLVGINIIYYIDLNN